MSLPTADKPTIIGLYGVPGAGKTYLSDLVKKRLPDFDFYDGSSLIHSVVKGGLTAFKIMPKDEQVRARERAMIKVSDECRKSGKIGVISGHFVFWEHETEISPQRIDVAKDWTTYTHIVYLNVDPSIIKSRRVHDNTRSRCELSEDHLRKWQKTEMQELREICNEKGVLFTSISEKLSSTKQESMVEQLITVLEDFRQHNEAMNVSTVDHIVEDILADHAPLETMLVLDADKTLAPQDTGKLFWAHTTAAKFIPDDPLRDLFKTQGYSYFSFRQAMLLYEEMSEHFDAICAKVADEVKMYSEMITLLARSAKEPHVGATVVTCGLRRVWETVLEKNGLSHVKVIGGGRLADGYVVTGSIKAQVVAKFQEAHLHILAFGDSPLDIEMFKKADVAYVVVGDEAARSTSMDQALHEAIDNGLCISQLILSDGARLRLSFQKLPKVELESDELNYIFKPILVHATGSATAKRLSTPTRDSKVSGYDLRQYHHEIGFFLATSYLGDIVGMEQFPIGSVQGGQTDGYRFRNEQETLIIPLMRGGYPLADGINKALDRASMVPVKTYDQIEQKHFNGKKIVILADYVINSGRSIEDFLTHLRQDYPDILVVVVAGVVQAKAVKIGDFAKRLRKDRHLHLVALRKSENSYVGQGATDTGDRLFNTTYM